MICVDEMRPCVSSSKWRWRESCHLLVRDGDIEALHEFAARLGLKRSWFHLSKRGIPHYDLTRRKRQLAVSLGAKEVTLRSIIKELRKGC